MFFEHLKSFTDVELESEVAELCDGATTTCPAASRHLLGIDGTAEVAWMFIIMSQSFNRTVMARDNEHVDGLCAPSLRSENIESSASRPREPLLGT